MDIVASIIKALFGSKADKDRKLIEPYLQKIKAVYPSIEALSNDELRARSEDLKKQIADYIAQDEARIVELKAQLENPKRRSKRRRRSPRRSTPPPSVSTTASRRSSTASSPRPSPS